MRGHGDAIDFVRGTDGVDFGGAVARLAAEAGLDAPRGNRHAQRERAAQIARERAEREAKRTAEEAEKRPADIEPVRRRVQRTVPIAGTLAELYLTQTRCIPKPLDGWPDVVRFDARARALVVVATGDDGAPQAAQWIHLARARSRFRSRWIPRRNAVFGSLGGL